MKSKLIILVLLLSVFALKLNAHTMWLEVKQQVKVGEEQKIRIYFGDYSWAKPTQTAKWYSDIAEVKLMLTTPSGNTTELTSMVQDSGYYYVNFIAKEAGVYKVWFSHEVKDVYKEKKLTYASAAYIVAGSPKAKSVSLSNGIFNLSWKDATKTKQMVYIENGKPKANASLSVVKEGDKENTYTLTTDKNGLVVFPKDWKGNYLIELTDSQKGDPKTFNDKEYLFDYKEFTYQFTL